MCGRYTVFTEDEILEMRAIIQEVSRRFGDDAIAKGEIRPTNNAPILTLDGNRLVPQPVSWGFPKWDGSGVVINARSESALQKTMFEKPLLSPLFTAALSSGVISITVAFMLFLSLSSPFSMSYIFRLCNNVLE